MADQTFAVTVVASGGGNRYRFDGDLAPHRTGLMAMEMSTQQA